MKSVVLCLAAAIAASMCASPAAAQFVEGVYEVTDPDTPLSFLQRQAVGDVREKDRQRYMILARDAGIFVKGVPGGHRLIKPIAEWTQRDLWVFREHYDGLSVKPENMEAWSTVETATLIRHLTLDGGGDGGD